MRQLLKCKKNNNGLTLIEVLLYISLFGLLIGGAVLASLQSISSASKGRTSAMIEQEGNFLLLKMTAALGASNSIVIPNFLAQSTILSVNLQNPVSAQMNPENFSYTRGNMLLAKGVGVPMVLNNSNISVSGVNFFYHQASTDSPRNVEINFRLSARGDDGTLIYGSFSSTHYFHN
jgi:type II secretory pathway pseudopilin PulG